MRIAAVLIALILQVFAVVPAQSHALEPGYLEISPMEGGQWRITWRKPQVGGQPMGIDVELPESCTPRRGPESRFDGRAFISGWIATCDAPFSSGEVFIDGLSDTATDVLVRYTSSPEISAQTFRLTPDAPVVVLPDAPTGWSVSSSYFVLGVDHILGGIDHLLFVFALLLLIPDIRRLIWAVTAFTIAHSITLATAALGLVSLPMPPVEAVIALSIVFLAAEILSRKGDADSLMQRAPWVIAFAFGLLHGLGFASALREIGLPEVEIPLALLTFNLGVEAGQLMFVAVVCAIALIIRRLAPNLFAAQLRPGAPGLVIAAYGIGSVAAFWTIERVMGFVV